MSSRASSSMQMHLTYFSLLSSSDVGNIFRHISSRPYHPRWSICVTSHDFLSLLRLGGCLLESTRNVVTHVRTVRSFHDKCLCFVVPFDNLNDVLALVGGKLKVLQINPSHPPDDTQQYVPWIGALASNGAMLRKLNIIDLGNFALGEEILSAVHGHVQHTQRISTCFSELQELYLSDRWRTVFPLFM